ncbi:UNVERIFIED_CONTAM: Homeobox protein ceh-18, partial [Eudyptes robustus]
ELEQFAQHFKRQRIKHGFTQGDVGVALGRRYGTDFSQTTISRFEALNLSFKNMCKLRPLMEEWMNEAEAAIERGASKRRKRTNLDTRQKDALDAYFIENPRPDHGKMAEIGAELDLDPDVVRVWFCNRRQKLRKV